jgi:tellurite resistance protein TehA-like permease
MDIFKDTGMIIVVVALFIFYLRMMQLRGKKKKLERQAALARMKESNKKKGLVTPATKNRNTPPFAITSWLLVVIAVALMLFGVTIRSTIDFSPLLETYWWIPTTAGILAFIFCFKVDAK